MIKSFNSCIFYARIWWVNS